MNVERAGGDLLLGNLWLAEALIAIGWVDQAEQVLLRTTGYAGDLGLLAEQVDPADGELLDNSPTPSATSASSWRPAGGRRRPRAQS